MLLPPQKTVLDIQGKPKEEAARASAGICQSPLLHATLIFDVNYNACTENVQLQQEPTSYGFAGEEGRIFFLIQ